MPYLVLITADGFGKRLDASEITLRHRNRQGVSVSKAPVAAALLVDGSTPELIIQSKRGKTQRIRTTSIPRRRRVSPSRGVRVMKLDPGDAATGMPPDAVASVAPVTEVATDAPNSSPKPMAGLEWGWGSAGLQEGESVGLAVVFGPARPVTEIEPGGELAVPRDEWAAGAVHRASRYSCAHCGREWPDPASVYACIDSHASGLAPTP